MKKYVIGVDIGGTKIATGLVSARGKLVDKVVLPTLAAKGMEVSLEQVYISIRELIKKSGIKWKDIEGIGLCAPGPLDPAKGVVHNPPNLPGWREVPLASLVRKKFKKRTKLENDANAAGIAEMIWGAARTYKHIFYVTVSTGIGTAVIIDGKIYHGKNGMAGEGGHVTIDYKAGKGKTCNCGNIGCIEVLASGPNTVKQVVPELKREKRVKTRILALAEGDFDKITMATIAEAAREGDRVAKNILIEQGRLLGIWLGSMISLLDPEVIVIGGGVSLAGDILFESIRGNIPEHTINEYAYGTPVFQAELKKDVGIFGAASIILQDKKRKKK